MDSPAPKIYPPLRIWVYLFISGSLICIIIYFIEKSINPFEFGSREVYIKKELSATNGKQFILLFGTSMMECGLDSTSRLETCIRERTGKSPIVLKIWKRATTLASISDHMPLLHQLQPHLVVVEANMLFYRSISQPLLSRCMQTFHDIVEFELLYKPYSPDSEHHINPLANATPDSFRNGLIDTADLCSFRKLATAWQLKGTHFLLVNFPLEASEELKKWNRSDTIIFFRNLNYLRQKISIQYYDPHLKLDTTYFYDHAHMNPKGSKIFSPFFCRELTLQLQSL